MARGYHEYVSPDGSCKVKIVLVCRSLYKAIGYDFDFDHEGYRYFNSLSDARAWMHRVYPTCVRKVA